MNIKGLAKAIEEKIGNEHKVKKVERRACENDVFEDVLIIVSPDNVGTVFRITEELPEEIGAAADYIIDVYSNAERPSSVKDLLNITGEDLKKKAVVCVCDLEHNKGYLDGVAYKQMHNLALYTRYIMDEAGVSIKISQALIDRMGIDFDDLYEHAVHNTKKHTRTKKMSDFLGIDDLECPLWIMTNESGIYGAGSITNIESIRAICRRTDSNKMVIIPSSVHELILLPMDAMGMEYSLDDVGAMVKDINAGVVETKDKLTDTVYMYDMTNDTITTTV